MSMAMNDPECDMSVTGTVNNDGIQEERLEVIFALREVRAYHYPPVLLAVNTCLL